MFLIVSCLNFDMLEYQIDNFIQSAIHIWCCIKHVAFYAGYNIIVIIRLNRIVRTLMELENEIKSNPNHVSS